MMTGRRFGKTMVMLGKLIEMAGKGSPCWYIAPTYRQAKMIAWRLLLKLLPRQMIRRKNETELFVELKNGHLIELKGADNEESLRGSPIFFGEFDETPFIKKHVLEEIILPATIDYNAPLWFAGTPSRGKDWFYKMYLMGKNPNEPDYEGFHFTTLDNPHLSEKFINKIRAKMSVEKWKQECLAIPGGAKGLVHSSFEETQHVIEPFEIPELWKRFRGMDWGIANPTCCLWGAVDPKNLDVYVYREHYRAGWTVRQHSIVIRNASKRENYESTVLDPSAFKRERDLRSVADDFKKEGISVLPGDNNIEKGVDTVNRYLTEHPRVFFFNTCYNTIEEIGEYMYEDSHDDNNIKEKPAKKKDHAMNALKYLLAEIKRRVKRNIGHVDKATLRRVIDAKIAATQCLPLVARRPRGLDTDYQTGYLT